MRRLKRMGWLAILLMLTLALAACGDDDSESNNNQTEPSDSTTSAPAEPTTVGGAFNPVLAPSLEISAPGQLPGCADPDDDACPLPLELALDGEASQDGITVNYPSRYFEVVSETAIINIAPAENYPFEEVARFEVYRSESQDAALSVVPDAELVEWQTAAGYEGTIAVQRDDEQEPPVTTVIGAFDLPDDQGSDAVVLGLTATGKYGWDLYLNVYTQMLDSLIVSGEENPG